MTSRIPSDPKVLAAAALLAGALSSPASLVGHWTGDNNALDSVAGNHGTLSGDASYAPGVLGSAFQFGGNGLVTIPSNPLYQFGTGDFSVAMWVNFDALQVNVDGFIHRDTYGVASPQGWLFNIDGGAGGVGWLVRNWAAGLDVSARVAPSSFQVDTWYHLVGVRDDLTVTLYIDGSWADDVVSASPIDVNNGVDLDIGGLGVGDRQYFNGMVDDVRLYNHALSLSEIQDLAGMPSNVVPEASVWMVVPFLGGLFLLHRRRSRDCSA